MPKFQILQRVDAYVDYIATVEADSASEAANLANTSPSNYEWKKRGICQFDAYLIVALDEGGNEISETERGKLASPYC